MITMKSGTMSEDIGAKDIDTIGMMMLLSKGDTAEPIESLRGQRSDLRDRNLCGSNLRGSNLWERGTIPGLSPSERGTSRELSLQGNTNMRRSTKTIKEGMLLLRDWVLLELLWESKHSRTRQITMMMSQEREEIMMTSHDDVAIQEMKEILLISVAVTRKNADTETNHLDHDIEMNPLQETDPATETNPPSLVTGIYHHPARKRPKSWISLVGIPKKDTIPATNAIPTPRDGRSAVFAPKRLLSTEQLLKPNPLPLMRPSLVDGGRHPPLAERRSIQETRWICMRWKRRW
jgi:hypothetical protein